VVLLEKHRASATHLDIYAFLQSCSPEGVEAPQLVKGTCDYEQRGPRALLLVILLLLLLLLLLNDIQAVPGIGACGSRSLLQ